MLKRTVLVLALLNAYTLIAQVVHLDGKWAFTGLRTTVFRVDGEKLYVGMVDYTDTLNFNRFVRQLPLDSSIYSKANVINNGDTIVIEARFPSIDHNLKLLYTGNDPTNIWFTGDVFFDSSKVIVANANCSRFLCV